MGANTYLDATRGPKQGYIVSEHVDVLREVTHGYGLGKKPKDYLDGFGEWLRTHMNEVPALLVVTQRPRELTRKQLKELKLALDMAGFPELSLQTAWRDMTNQDIAASIVGHVRRAAVGDALIPYEKRVDNALEKMLASRAWTAPQRTWLEKIGLQLKREVVVDRAAFDHGIFQTQGGFDRLNRVFEGKLEGLLGDLHEAVWRDAG